MDARALAELAADPSRMDDLPREELVDVVAELERMRARALLRLSQPDSSNGAQAPAHGEDGGDRMLDAESVADVLNVDTRYVYDHAADWPFTRRLSPRKLRFSERGLYRWLETRP